MKGGIQVLPTFSAPGLKKETALCEGLNALASFPFRREAKEILQSVACGSNVLSREETGGEQVFAKAQGTLLLALSLVHGAGRSPFQLSQWRGLDKPFVVSFETGQTVTLFPLVWEQGFDQVILLSRSAFGLGRGASPSVVFDQMLFHHGVSLLKGAVARLGQEDQLLAEMIASPLAFFKELGKKHPFSLIFVFLSAMPPHELRHALLDFTEVLPDGIEVERDGQALNLKQWLARASLEEAALFERIHFLLRWYERGGPSFLTELIRDVFLHTMARTLSDKRLAEEVARLLRATQAEQYGTRLDLVRTYLNFG